MLTVHRSFILMEINTGTVAKRARVRPRTPVVLTMKMLFSRRILSTSGLVSPIIVPDNVLRIRLELIKYRNDNPMEKFNRFEVVSNNLNFG